MLNRCFESDGFLCPIELPDDNVITTLPLRFAQSRLCVATDDAMKN